MRWSQGRRSARQGVARRRTTIQHSDGLPREPAIPNHQSRVWSIDSGDTRSVIDSICGLDADGFLIRSYIPISLEFEALLGEVGAPHETETLVDRHRGWVRQRDPHIRSVHILALGSFEPLVS